jgi:uncharacterized protein (TIGR03437 family)
MTRISLALILFFAPVTITSSQQISLSNPSAAPGSSALLPVAFLSQSSGISALQFDLEYENAAMSVAITPGNALGNSGKNFYSADVAPNKKRVLIAGPDQNPIADGTLVNLFINLNPNISMGAYSLKFTNVVGSGPNGVAITTASLNGSITVQSSSAIQALLTGGVLNAASFLSGPVAPGEIVTLIGSGIGTSLPGSQVLFGGTPAPILFNSPNQINAVVPFGVSGTSTLLVVNLSGHTVAELSLPVAKAVPAIFTVNSSGIGQGAILNQDSTLNSASNTAEKGSVVVIYATGAGQTDPAGVNGQITGAVLPKPLLPVTVLIDGLEAEVQYAGAAPELIAGVIQVNAVVPAEVHSGPAVSIVLVVGKASSQAGVTLAIR